MNYFIWNGINSLTYGVVPEKLPAPMRDRQRIEKIEIAGRDGFLTFDDDVFDGSVRVAECAIIDRTLKDTVFNWLRGAGTVIFSNEPTRAYRARIDDQIQMERVNDLFHTFLVKFDCQPFAYEATQSIYTLTGSNTITNPGTRYSRPIITVTGTGTLTVGEYEMVISESGITINSEIEECYKNGISKNDQMTGDYPIIMPGDVDIDLDGITSVQIVGNWRWH